MTPLTADPTAALASEIKAFIDENQSRHLLYSILNGLFLASNILLGLGVTIASIFHQSTVAAVLGAFVTAFVAAQAAFSVGPRSAFYRRVLNMAKNLRTDLEAGSASQQKRGSIRRKLRELRLLEFGMEERQAGAAASASFAPEDEEEGQERLVRNRLAQRTEIAFLNRLTPPPGAADDPDQREFRTRVANLKLALMRSVWGEDWGDYDLFEAWVFGGGACDPVPDTVKAAADHYRSGQEGVA
jgi:hypothetical protein